MYVFILYAQPTIGIDFVSKNVTCNGKMLRLQLWDTAGQERFRSLIPSYLRDCQAAFIIYDLTNEQTYNNLSKWIDFVKDNRGQQALIYVVGNKLDLQQNRCVDSDAAKQKFKQLGIKYYQTSAKTGDKIQGLFEELCADLLQINGSEIKLQVQQSKVFHDGDIAQEKQFNKKIQSKPAQKLTKKQNEDPRRIKQKDCC